MANANTFAQLFNLPAQTINATAETLLVNAAAATAQLNMPPAANVNGHAFRVRLIGTATGGTSATLTLKFYLGVSATGTNIAAFTVSGAAIPAAGGNFDVNVELIWDSVSQTVHGFKGGHTNGTLTTTAALDNSGASVVSAAGLTFVASATFGAALATNSVTIQEFSLEQV